MTALRYAFFTFGTVFHLGDICAPLFVHGLGRKITVQNVLGCYFRLRTPIDWTLSANDCQQTDDMHQTVGPLNIILLFVGCMAFIRNAAISVSAVVYCRTPLNITFFPTYCFIQSRNGFGE